MLTDLFDIILSVLFRPFFWLLKLIPHSLRIKLFELVIKTIFALDKSLYRVSYKNLSLVFPDKDLTWQNEVLRRMQFQFALSLADYFRLDQLSLDWVDAHIDFPERAQTLAIRERHRPRGTIFVTGHLGSFDLLAHVYALKIHPLSFIVRNFKLSRLDRVVHIQRELNGNVIIDRKGAFEKVISNLKAGIDVGMLFDQNVTRNHAVFVNFFGRLAATTKTIGIAALRTGAPIVATCIFTKKDQNDKYQVDIKECEYSDIANNSALSSEQKVFQITERLTRIFEKMVLDHHDSWFWMHRRWKTTPEGVEEDFYS